ncbi:MAG: response regulator transcription factor [Acidimicrobiales bacterium]
MTLTFREVERRALADQAPPVILIIDDDHLTRDSLAATLSIEGFDVITASTGEEGVALVTADAPALVILDTQIGDSDGFTVFRRITDVAPWVPVIMITEEDDELDAVLALEAGAADHITKPPRPRELTARIRAVLRRVGRQPQSLVPAAPSGAYTFGPVTIDVSRREATLHGRDVELSRKEFDLLALLVSEGGHVVTRKQCMDRIWRDRKKGDSRTLDTHPPDHREGGGIPLQAVGVRPTPRSPMPSPTGRQWCAGGLLRFEAGTPPAAATGHRRAAAAPVPGRAGRLP